MAGGISKAVKNEMNGLGLSARKHPYLMLHLQSTLLASKLGVVVIVVSVFLCFGNLLSALRNVERLVEFADDPETLRCHGRTDKLCETANSRQEHDRKDMSEVRIWSLVQKKSAGAIACLSTKTGREPAHHLHFDPPLRLQEKVEKQCFKRTTMPSVQL